jgi:hypothetical protein
MMDLGPPVILSFFVFPPIQSCFLFSCDFLGSLDDKVVSLHLKGDELS